MSQTSELATMGFDLHQPISYVNTAGTSVVATYQGHPYNIDQTATPTQWAALQADISAGLITVAAYASPQPPTLVQRWAQFIAIAQTRLDAIDAASIRPTRALATSTATDADRTYLTALEREAAAIRALMAGSQSTAPPDLSAETAKPSGT